MGDSTEHYRFDAKGNVIETETRYSRRATGAPDQIVRTKYDEQDRELEEDSVDANGKLGGVSIYKRDGAGNIVEEDSWINDHRPPHAVSQYRYDFDSHGNWIRRYETRTGVKPDSYDYGPVGTLIRTITYYDVGR